jgi:hypothetical protein
MLSVSTPRSSNRTCGFPASGFRTRVRYDSHAVSFESHPGVETVRPSLFPVARPSANRRAFAPFHAILEPRPLGSAVVSRFIATTGLSATRCGPVSPSRASGWALAAHRLGFPVLTRLSFAHMPSPIPRRSCPVRLSLAFRSDCGLRCTLTSSASALNFSRLARRLLMLWPLCSLTARSGLFHQRLRPPPLPTVNAPVASGWSDSCRVGYPPPTGVTRPLHGALKCKFKRAVSLAVSFNGNGTG